MVTAEPSPETVRAWLDCIPDPELPAVTITDLGIVRDVSRRDDGTLAVGITPTYSGCPATAVIAAAVEQTLREHGIERIDVRMRLAPAWTTDWITPRGRERLREFGIAPPAGDAAAGLANGVVVNAIVRCPRCNSGDTSELSRFGSTPCKALYRCRSCSEPFDYVKPH